MKNTSTIRFAKLSIVFALLAFFIPLRSVAQEHKFIDTKNGNAELSNSGNLLCHTSLEIRIAITNAEGDCKWTLDANGQDHLIQASTSGANNDTVTFAFDAENLKESKRLGITVTWIKDNAPTSYTIFYQAACAASQPGTITVLTNSGTTRIGYENSTEELNTEVYCEGLRYRLKVADGDDRVYSDLAPLQYAWFLAASEKDVAGSDISEGYHSGPDKNTSSSLVINSYNGKYWQVRAKTCDYGFNTDPSAMQIKNIIRKNILANGEDLTLTQIRFTRPPIAEPGAGEGGSGGPGGAPSGGSGNESGGENKPIWLPIEKTEDADEMAGIACVYYSSEFNGKASNNNMGDFLQDGKKTGAVSMAEYVSGYIDLEAGPFDRKDGILFPHYRFNWIFDTADLEFATDKMLEGTMRADSGFGVDKSRVCFRVKENKNGSERSTFSVKVEVSCPECEAEATANGISDPLYRKMSDKLVFTRIDTLPEELPYTTKLRDQAGDEINYKTELPELCGNTLHMFCAKLDNNYDGRLTFMWVLPDVNWRPGSGIEGCRGIITPEIALTETQLGRAYNLYVYPRNQCFQNGSRDVHRDTVRVYVKALPPSPQIYDPLDKANPNFKGVVGENGMIDFKGKASVLLCNYNASYDGIPNRDYYLVSRNSPIKPKISGQGGVEGYVIKLPEGFSSEDISYQILSLDPNSTEANDTNIVRFTINETAHGKFKGKSQLAFGFSAANECGAGSMLYYPVNIIDTLNVFAHVQQLDHADPGLDSAAWACEGVAWQWELKDVNKRYMTDALAEEEKGGMGGGMPPSGGDGGGGDVVDKTGALRNTDRIEYVWTFPDPTWHFAQASAEGANPTSVVFGAISGQVRLALRNRCGISKARPGDYVNVNPFTRVKIKVTGPEIDDTRNDAYDPLLAPGAPGAASNQEFLVQPCQGTSLVYAADTSYLTEEYLWSFPKDWKVIEKKGYETTTWRGGKDSLNFARTDNTGLINKAFGIDEMRVMVEVGADTGDIMVIGRKAGCHFYYDDVAPDLSRDYLPYGHRADTLHVRIRPYTGKPSLLAWPRDLCARTVQTLAVAPDPTQDAKTQSETYFTWTFPEDWKVVKSNTRQDTVVVDIPNRITEEGTIGGDYFRSDTVKVYSHRYDCNETNQGDSTVYAFRLVDTLALASESFFRNLRQDASEPLNLSPCEGDTVEYTLQGKFHDEMDSIVLRWSLAMDLNGTQDFVTGDSIDLTGWRVLNQEGKYSINPRNPRPGLKMIVGRAPLRILAYGAAHCGESSPTKVLDLTPISLVRDKATWVEGGALICGKERAVFRHDSIQFANAYEWHYPWGALVDTTRVGGRNYIRRTFSDTTAFAKGDVYVVPFNRCGRGPESDKINITDVIGDLNAPTGIKVVAADGVSTEVSLRVLADTAFDTVCLRHNYAYQAAYTDSRYPTQSTWKFDWFSLSEPFHDSLAMQNTPADSSEAIFFKRPDATATSGFDFVNMGVRVRHQQCRRYGDTLILKVLPYDTAVASTGLDYIVDFETGKADIQTKPCGADTATWFVNKAKFVPAVTSYQFVWGVNPKAPLGRTWSNTGKTMDGAAFEWLNGTAESGDLDDLFYADDTLHFSIPNFAVTPDSLYVAVNVKNRCGISHLPSFLVKSVEKLEAKDGIKISSNANFCDREKLVFEASVNHLVNSRVWYFPWDEDGDTITGESHLESKAYSDSLQEGYVYFIPVNGCGEGPHSDSIKIEDIKRIPAKPRNPSFDSLCMNQPAWLKAEFPGGTDPDKVEILWTKLRGQAGAAIFAPRQNTDSCRLAPTDVKAEPLRISVKSRVKGCTRYSDSLVVNIVSMDTLAFVIPTQNEDDEEGVALGKFDLDLTQTLVAGGKPVSLTPCAGTQLIYGIKVDPAKAWSVDPAFESYLSWNRAGATPSVKPDEDLYLGGSNWMFDDDNGDTIGKVHYGQLPVVVGASDNLYFHVTLKNRCGISRSQGLMIVPDRKVTQKPRLSSTPLCLGAEAALTASNLQDVVETLEWIHPWASDSKKTTRNVPYIDVMVGPETGNIILWAGNHCQARAMSDTLKVDAVMQTPKRPVPAWLPEGKDYTWNADTVVEYICLHGQSALTVKPGVGDGSALEFVWNFVNGSNMMDIRYAEGASYILSPKETVTLGDSAMLSVRGNYRNCGTGYDGPTLYIRVRFIDTLSFTPGATVFYQSKGGDNGTFVCPDAELKLWVDNPNGMEVHPMSSYHWVLPGNGGAGAWKIKDAATGNPNLSSDLQFPVEGDSNHSSIVAIVGEAGGRVSVQMRTPASVLGCPYFSSSITLNENFTVRTRPDAPRFTTFAQKPCVDQEAEYVISSVEGARAYRWQVPAGWSFHVGNSGTVRDDTIWEVTASEANATRCTIVAGQDTGYIRVWAIDSCNGGPAASLELSSIAYPQDTARLTVLGDHAACIDSTIDLLVRGDGIYMLSDADYDLEVYGKGSENNNFERRYGETPDILYVTSHSFDTVYMKFTPKFAACPNNVEPYVHFILADTTPEIKGFITGPDTVCSDNIYEYEFQLDPEMGHIDITCTWDIPNDAWEVVETPDPMKVVLHFLDVPAADGEQSRTTDTLICYPRGMCGTGLPVKLPIFMREADPFADAVVVSAVRPCVGTEINVHLRDSALYNPYPDSIKFVWNTPDNWQRLAWDGEALATDSLPATLYRVQLDTADAVIAVRMWRKGACGLSQTLRSTPIHVRDSAAKATITERWMLYPCYTRPAYTVVLEPKDDVDSAVWTLPSDPTLSLRLSTRAVAAFKYDSLWIDNPDGRLEHITLPVRTVNECGHRDTVFVVRPITDIEKFTEPLQVPRVCFGDTSYAWITLPKLQIEQGTWYVWDLRDSTHTFVRQWDDTVAAMQFLSSPAGDSVHIYVTAINDCAADTSRRADVKPYNFRIWPSTDPDTAVYLQSGVRLLIDSVAPGTKDDYTYVWTPANRVVDYIPATRTLVQETETFYVRAQQKAPEDYETLPFYRRARLCAVNDSVKIVVDSVFQFVQFSTDTICVDLIDSIFAFNFGGNRENYHIIWYEYIDDEWALMPELYDSVLFAFPFTTPGNYYYRVVGFDSTFLRDEETDELILMTSHYDTLEIDVQVYDMQVYFRNIASEEVDVPMGGRVEFLTRIEDGSGRYRFDWAPESMVSTLDSLTGNMNTVALFREGELALTVTDSASGCVRETSVRVKPGKGNNIPNVITPNGDGYNDIFLKGVTRLTIFTSWGEQIFHSEDGNGWDGTRNGQPVRPGEYLYVAEIEGTNGVRTVKGVVTVKYE